jgi:polar amino acid transport system permease protein
MVPYALAALVYWVVCLLIEFVLGRIEKKMNYYRS